MSVAQPVPDRGRAARRGADGPPGPRGRGAARRALSRDARAGPACRTRAAIMRRYPHQLSGGQQQRVVIAMALLANPDLLIMDEPTTGLDVTVEAAVLDLVAELRRELDTAILYISHNLGVVARVCDRVGVMYAGELVEEGRRRRRCSCAPAPPVHARPARLRAARSTPAARRSRSPPSRARAARRRAAARLRLRAALQLRRRRVPRGAAGGRGRRRPGTSCAASAGADDRAAAEPAAAGARRRGRRRGRGRRRS